MDSRVAVIAIIIEDINSAEQVNAILHEYGEHIIGRMMCSPYSCRIALTCSAELISSIMIAITATRLSI